MNEIIYEIVTDSDGVDCYIKRGEIVRCRDCKYREWIAPCPLGEIIDDDGFCSLGERREP